jgi:hypothetical protein
LGALIVGYEVAVAATAIVVSILSFKTLRAIRHLGVGRPFWIPIFASSLLFLIGSALTILLETGFSLPRHTEAVYISRILALGLLAVGVFSYSRRVTGSLNEEFTIPDHLYEERRKVEAPDEDAVKPEPPISEKHVQETIIEESAATLECQHHLGYLQTLPKSIAIPDECLGCEHVIECRHSLAKTVKNPTLRPHSP